MAFSSAYSYRERNVFDIKTLVVPLRFFIVNLILALIFLFLTLEELDWVLLSSREKIKDIAIDNSAWNIKNILSLLKF
tara:strand:- start:48 stop:281 length:234 start_codon:yes stop_codon:yes gene_type:complete